MSGKKKIGLFVILPVIIFVSFFVVCLLSATKEKQSYKGTFVTHDRGELNEYLYKTSNQMCAG